MNNNKVPFHYRLVLEAAKQQLREGPTHPDHHGASKSGGSGRGFSKKPPITARDTKKMVKYLGPRTAAAVAAGVSFGIFFEAIMKFLEAIWDRVTVSIDGYLANKEELLEYADYVRKHADKRTLAMMDDLQTAIEQKRWDRVGMIQQHLYEYGKRVGYTIDYHRKRQEIIQTAKELQEMGVGAASAAGGPTNNVGDGNIAGANGDPPVNQKKYKKKMIMRRPLPLQAEGVAGLRKFPLKVVIGRTTSPKIKEYKRTKLHHKELDVINANSIKMKTRKASVNEAINLKALLKRGVKKTLLAHERKEKAEMMAAALERDARNAFMHNAKRTKNASKKLIKHEKFLKRNAKRFERVAKKEPPFQPHLKLIKK